MQNILASLRQNGIYENDDRESLFFLPQNRKNIMKLKKRRNAVLNLS